MSCPEPCTRILECGHKCAGFCSDPCHCAINCPEYAQARLEVQLAQAQLNAGSQLSDTQTSSSKSPISADWKHMVQDPDAYDRKERLKTMGHVKLTKDTLETAFGGIKETYIAVSDQNGRRVQEVSKNTDFREEARLRKQMAADDGLFSGFDGRPSRQPAKIPMTKATARAQDLSTNGVALNSHTSTSRGGRNIVREGWRSNGGSIGSRQGSQMREIPRPATINAFAAKSSAAPARVRHRGRSNARSNGQPIGVSTRTIQSDIRQVGDSGTSSSIMLQQDDVPNSASAVGGLGFDEELSQAIRRVGQLEMEKGRHPSPQIGWSQTPDEDLMDSGEPLIDFGNNDATSMVDNE
ncbi:hypothetical protein N0V82_004727 [Gnomoniopsis sp. IMI 355080]|nr:hypothetical protein N0V82_004727 [Gnomoniopsis sp. IMI 355080]